MLVEQVESLLDRFPVTPPSHGETKKEERKYSVGSYNFVIIHDRLPPSARFFTDDSQGQR
jgi:hypothetical protein